MPTSPSHTYGDSRPCCLSASAVLTRLTTRVTHLRRLTKNIFTNGNNAICTRKIADMASRAVGIFFGSLRMASGNAVQLIAFRCGGEHTCTHAHSQWAYMYIWYPLRIKLCWFQQHYSKSQQLNFENVIFGKSSTCTWHVKGQNFFSGVWVWGGGSKFHPPFFCPFRSTVTAFRDNGVHFSTKLPQEWSVLLTKVHLVILHTLASHIRNALELRWSQGGSVSDIFRDLSCIFVLCQAN